MLSILVIDIDVGSNNDVSMLRMSYGTQVVLTIDHNRCHSYQIP